MHHEDEDGAVVPSVPPTPLGYLAALSGRGAITPVERDAGEIFHRIGRHAISDLKASATVQYPWRDAKGGWSVKSEPKRLAVAAYEAALEAAGGETRRRDLVAAFVARDPAYSDDAVPSIRAGLAAIARHWWGPAAIAATSRNGVTLPRVIDYDVTPDNDNAPTPERAAQGDVQNGRCLDGFERLLIRGQLDEDKEVAIALYAAGVRYESDHAVAFGGAYRSPDYARPVVDGGGEAATPIAERAERARSNLKAAREAMGRRCWDVVDAVVLQGLSLEAAGRAHCGYRGIHAATAAAKERLNAGLRSLAVYYGIAVRRRAA